MKLRRFGDALRNVASHRRSKLLTYFTNTIFTNDPNSIALVEIIRKVTQDFHQNWETHPSTSIHFFQGWVFFWVKSKFLLANAHSNTNNKNELSHSPSKYFLPVSAGPLPITPKLDPSLLALSTPLVYKRRLAAYWRIHSIRLHEKRRSHGIEFDVVLTRAFCFVCLPCGCFLINATEKEYCIKYI